jgi:taurine dioxygenase
MSGLQRSQSVAADLDIRPLVRRFVGYSQADWNHLFELFQSHITKLENTVRWRWKAGDLAMWDNTATQHCAINGYGDQKRVVRRSTIGGEAPLSVDDRTSVTKWRTTGPNPMAHSTQSAAA